MSQQAPVIDVYCHCGRTKYEPLPVVQRALEVADVSRAVLVQHLGEYDNSYIAQAVDAEPERFVGVFHIDPDGSDPIAEIKRHGALDAFEGVRFEVRLLHRIRDQYETAVELGLNIVLCSILGMHEQLPELRRFLEAHPEQPLMITHWGWPAVGDAPDFAEYQNVLALSEYPGVYLQASGMSMYSDDYLELFRPAAAAAYEAFGADRMVWGSNFPVSGGDPDGYARELAPFREGRYPFPDTDLPAILGGTASKLWFK